MDDRPSPQGTIALRLALAFLAVALAAVALLAGLTAAFTAADVSGLASRQRTELTTAIAVAAGTAWDRGGQWADADLSRSWAWPRGPGPWFRFATRRGSTAARRPVSPGTPRARSSPRPSWCTASRWGRLWPGSPAAASAPPRPG